MYESSLDTASTDTWTLGIDGSEVICCTILVYLDSENEVF